MAVVSRCLAILSLSLGALAQSLGNFNSSTSSSVPEQPWQTWGPYRPNLYFGVRPTVPETLLMGLMWANGDDRKTMLKSLRDTCEQNDGMQGYGWTFYDTRAGGSQAIHDTQLQLELRTDFLKSEDGNSWAVRITGTPKSGAADVKTSLILHTAVEKVDSNGPKSLVCDNRSKDGTQVEAACHGDMPALGKFEFQVLGDTQNKPIHDTVVKSIEVTEDRIWQAKSVLVDLFRDTAGNGISLNDAPGQGNMHFVQLAFQGPFQVTFTYQATGTPLLEANAVDSGISSLQSSFATRVDGVFPRASPFQQEKYTHFTQEILSNLLGGLGFFHGDTKVDDSHAPEYEETDANFWVKAAAARSRASITTTPPLTLLSHTPSRPFFPRGFLWDEGFHLLPVIEWDLDLAVSVLHSWLSLMDDDGWIGREQILGPEARSRVPPEFQVQYPHYANPPTLSLLVPIIIAKLTGTSPYAGHPSVYLSSPDRASAMLRTIYPLLARHYAWFRRTQAGNFTEIYPRPASAIPGTGFRWRGRTPQHTLTSGLDDYPRADPPHPGELHIDALAWVGASAAALEQVASYLGETDDAAKYASHVADVKHNLDALHWDSTRKTYCDATVDSSGRNEYVLVCREGYLSLFPLLLGLMDATHPNLDAVLDLLGDPDRLWSEHGLRSLSKSDEGYAKDEDYWRGAVWMNLNVLAVLRLRDVGLSADGPAAVRNRAAGLAAQLRQRLVDTVYGSWEATGFFWEQYSDVTGEGRRSRAFTGWTATVVLLMGLEFPGQVVGSEPVESSGSGRGALLVLAGVVGVPAVAVMLISGVRRRAMVAVAGVVNLLLGWRTSWKERGGRGYEQVIDLDERER
ncbi:glycoside hydrolase [Echria macrotheca]|uniref:Mannosyl-oligosaccharide glucosidase n=1 Tax=Echria macrotheca TaxID=438768 RepID=A0AAJ0B8T9_9PEZI|nr:glycoside hydrolase [Echria macrotheca]